MEIDKIYNEDCMTTMARMEDGFIDLTVTSPPYDSLRKYKGIEWGEHIWKPIIRELYRVAKKGGVVVWVVGDATIKGSETGTSFRQALWAMEVGFRLHDTMIYAKTNPIPLTHNRYEQQFEYMLVFSKGKPKTFNPIMRDNKQVGCIKGGTFCHDGDKLGKRHKDVGVKKKSIERNIWFYDVGMNNSSKDKIAFKHRAIFPEALAHDHILTWSNFSSLIYDPFLGSGTTAKMSLLLNRHYIGSEISKEYCDIAEERLRLAREEKEIKERKNEYQR